MTGKQILEIIADQEPELLRADGFEDAVIGLVEGACRPPVLCYDYERCVEILMKRDGMDRETAEEYLDFNTIGAYVGPNTPLFLHDYRATIEVEVEPPMFAHDAGITPPSIKDTIARTPSNDCPACNDPSMRRHTPSELREYHRFAGHGFTGREWSLRELEDERNTAKTSPPTGADKTSH